MSSSQEARRPYPEQTRSFDTAFADIRVSGLARQLSVSEEIAGLP